MGNSAEVHNFLRVGFSEHSKACLTASVYVGMVAENVECVRRHATRGNMNYTGKKLSGDLVHIGDHKEKSLRSGICCCERACCERAVNGACRACFGLHFNNLYLVSENVFEPARRPCVGVFRHRAGRRDGIDCGNFRKRIRNVCGSGVTVHGNHFSCHVFSSVFYLHIT